MTLSDLCYIFWVSRHSIWIVTKSYDAWYTSLQFILNERITQRQYQDGEFLVIYWRIKIWFACTHQIRNTSEVTHFAHHCTYIAIVILQSIYVFWHVKFVQVITPLIFFHSKAGLASWRRDVSLTLFVLTHYLYSFVCEMQAIKRLMTIYDMKYWIK